MRGANWLLGALCTLLAAPAEGRLLAQLGSSRQMSLSAASAGADSAGACPLATGGYCYIFDCEDSRGGSGAVECNSGHCLCKTGYCAVNGACVVAPAAGPGNELPRKAAPIRLMAHPDKCLATMGEAVSVKDCGDAPERFSLPVGGIGQIRLEANMTRCLSVVSDAAAVAKIVVKDCSVAAGTAMQFVLPGGAMGLVRWNQDPAKCLAVLPVPAVAVPAGASASPVGRPVALQACSEQNLLEMFGLSDEAPAPFMPCVNGTDCAQMEASNVLAFCVQFPNAPSCALYRRCSPGGCNNGKCVSGYCECNSGFTGDSCEVAVQGAVPLAAPTLLQYALSMFGMAS